ncbi:hypothetical protein FGO68_gene1976 [Halteria grandinella]|uniref:Uncharacterized protein n=1 Tax=Halteria grandinella TaxID=5974 RepID=A0A8J8NZI9_HALGN|nr:hypothetical protein FGO68_gene1976 [Halteria grandinella]
MLKLFSLMKQKRKMSLRQKLKRQMLSVLRKKLKMMQLSQNLRKLLLSQKMNSQMMKTQALAEFSQTLTMKRTRQIRDNKIEEEERLNLGNWPLGYFSYFQSQPQSQQLVQYLIHQIPVA